MIELLQKLIRIKSISPSDMGCFDLIENELKKLNLDLEVPTIGEFGVKKETFFQSIDTMATQAIASGSPNNNPIVPSHDELVSLYKKLWS